MQLLPTTRQIKLLQKYNVAFRLLNYSCNFVLIESIQECGRKVFPLLSATRRTLARIRIVLRFSTTEPLPTAFTKVLRNRKSDPKKGMDKPFTDAEASHLIGLSYRVTLREAILTGKFDNLLVPITPRRKLYDRINSISYEDYYEKLIKPQLVPQGISANALNVASDLRNRQAERIKANGVHLLLTSNDFLLTSEHLAWFRENFSNRHIYYKKGGHMGNLWKPNVQDALRQVIRPDKTQAGAGKANP